MQNDKLGISFFGGDEESGNVFIVETKAPQGYELCSHEHVHAHTSVLVSGTAIVHVGDTSEIYSGYNLITIPKGVTHSVKAVTDIIWLCIWNADNTKGHADIGKEALKLKRTGV